LTHFDADAERYLIGAALYPDAVKDILAFARVEFFGNGRFKNIYKVVRDLHSRGHEIGILPVMLELKKKGELENIGGMGILAELQSEVTTLSSVPYVMERLAELYKLRQLIDVTKESSILLDDDPLQLDDQVEKLSKALEIETKNIQKPAVSLSELGDLFVEGVENITEEEDKTIIKSGFPMVDDLVELVPTEMTCIAGRPSMGKSAYALQIGLQAAQTGKHVLFVSMEMPAKGIMQRIFSMLTEVPGYKIKKAKQLDTNDWVKIREAQEKLIGLPLYLTVTGTETIEQLRRRIRLLRLEHGALDMVIVDYMQLMSGSNPLPNMNRVNEVSEISRGLKLLAMEEQVVVIALSQLSRAVELRQDKRPILSDLKESGSIEQDCDIVKFIYRDEYYNKENSSKRGEAEIIVAKNRAGALGTIDLNWRPTITKFETRFSVVSNAM
jgi:replicative DNA helicase